jgi:hypothetical protein
MYLQYGQDSGLSNYERVWMGETHLEKTMLMFPQERKLVFIRLRLHAALLTCLKCPPESLWR